VSDRAILTLHTIMILALAALIWLIYRQHTGELQMIHDRLDTQMMNGGIVPPPPADRSMGLDDA
jgi:hypothetical protein